MIKGFFEVMGIIFTGLVVYNAVKTVREED